MFFRFTLMLVSPDARFCRCAFVPGLSARRLISSATGTFSKIIVIDACWFGGLFGAGVADADREAAHISSSRICDAFLVTISRDRIIRLLL